MIGEERNLRRGNRRRMHALLTKENPASGHDPPSSHQITRMRKYPLARTNQQGPKREDVSGADSCWFSWDKENGRFLYLLLVNNLYVAQPINNGCAVVRNRCFVASTTVPQFRLGIVESWPTVFCTDMNFHHQVSDCYCCRYFVRIIESWPTTGVPLIEKISTNSH